MQLSQLLNNIAYQHLGASLPSEIQDLTFDSRRSKAGSVFVAICGSQVDGHLYISKAIAQGAKVIVCEQVPEELAQGVSYLIVKNSQETLGYLAANFYEHPSRNIQLVGVTGTNGKTTTASLLYKLFTQLGYAVGLISTVEHRIGKDRIPSTHTTPDALTIQALLAQMSEAGCEYAFMEVSSHAIDQERIHGLHFTGGVFTNITHEHLDYHGTFQNYIYTKKRFFDQLPATAFALSNADDRRGEIMLQNTKARKFYYALRKMADFKTKILENNLSGLILDLENREFHTQLVGDFNAYNLLCVYAVANLLEANKEEVLQVLSKLGAVEGRFDYIQASNGIVGIVDYAHTPDALEKVLNTINKVRTGTEQIITVVGCGGDRDVVKRPLMAKIATQYSTQTILTSDNPRTENPDSIIRAMETGVPASHKHCTLSITDRRQAIRTACKLAKAGDIILVAGKGHEKYQEINKQRFPFDDKEELRKAFEAYSTIETNRHY
ncbi:MAG: UDP-N-acetylmuramoyl-L-alanyl-D-glutamate--2,6-diaminopimelate ligase [Saprospiraceae bacterium]|nr:UDP-N-acetylmuramoyl-L-alanyl-D-glutamate--2,6-diaminopimelate ligase [Saprospiraceae bacterium]